MHVYLCVYLLTITSPLKCFLFFLITVTASVMSFFFCSFDPAFLLFLFDFLDVSLIRRGGKKWPLLLFISSYCEHTHQRKSVIQPFFCFFLLCFSLFILNKLNCRVCVKNYAHAKTITTATRNLTHTRKKKEPTLFSLLDHLGQRSQRGRGSISLAAFASVAKLHSAFLSSMVVWLLN